MLLDVHVDLSKRFYIIHPKLQEPNRYLHHFMDFAPLLYVRLDGENLSFADVQQQIEAARRDQLETVSLADVTMLILDEGDRVQGSVMEDVPGWLLFECGVKRVTLVSRYVPCGVFTDDDLHDLIQLTPINESLMLYDYLSLLPRDDHLLEVNAFGDGQVYLNGEPVDMYASGLLPRNLFYYFIDRRISRRDSVFEVFWPSTEPGEATNVFHVTKRQVNGLIGIQVMEYHSGFYRVASNIDVRYDVDVFRRFVQEAHMPDKLPDLHEFETALRLYQNHFLTGLTGTNWVEERREELKELRVELYAELAGYYLERGNSQKALGLYLQAYTDNMTREDIIAHIMRLYLDAKQSCAALRIYERTRQIFIDTLNLRPGKALRHLAEKAETGCADEQANRET